MKYSFSKMISPDWEVFLRCLSRQGTPQRVHFIELYLDNEMKEAICDRFGLVEDLNPSDPHFAEYLTWLMGYETLCYALLEQRDLVAAISQRLLEIYQAVVQRMLQFERVKVIWGSDDMGFCSGTLINPRDLWAFVLPGHCAMAQAAHAAGRPYLLHSCGKLGVIMNDLLEDTTDRRLFLPAPPVLPTAHQRYPETIASLSLPHF